MGGCEGVRAWGARMGGYNGVRVRGMRKYT